MTVTLERAADRGNETTVLEISVTDPHIADVRLLPLLLEGGQTTVSAFGRKQHNLEDIFLQMVEGDTTYGNV